jgi:hypothetical protein
LDNEQSLVAASVMEIKRNVENVYERTEKYFNALRVWWARGLDIKSSNDDERGFGGEGELSRVVA